MADVNANIGINIDTSQSLAEIKNLQRQLAQLYTSINKGSAAAAAAQKGLATNLMNTINAGGKFYAQMGTIRTSTESFTHALEKNKLSMREYFRYAGASTKTFGRLFKSEFDTIGKVAEERVKKMQTQYIKLGRDASGAMKAISITPTTLNMKDYGNQVAVAAQKQALLNQLLKQGSTNLLNFGKNTQWAGRQLMVGFTIPLAYFGTAAAKTFMDLEAQALKFRRVYGGMFTTTAETNKALQDVQLLAQEFTKYGVAVSKTMEMAASAAAMGKTGAELNAQVAEATRLSVLGNVEQQQALDTTISLTNAFGISADELSQKINFLNSVENQTVTAIEDLTIAIPKAGPVIKQLGGSVEDLAFFLTAMREGGINASEGANALKSGLASLINPTKKAAAMLSDMGINIAAIVEQNQGNLREIVIDFAQALDTLSPLERSRAIEQLFGKFQFARLSTLFQNVTKDGTQASRVLELAGKSVEELAILSERELKAVEDAVGTNFREAVEQLKVAIAPIGKEFLKAITPVVKFLGELLDKFNNLSDGSKKFIVILTTLLGLVGPTLLMTFGLLANGAANIIKLFVLMRQGFLKLTGNSTNLAQQTQYLNSEQMEAAVVAASLNQAHTKLTQQFTLEASAVAALRQAYIQATAAAARFAAANPGMMLPGFKGLGPIKGGGAKGFNKGTMEVPGYQKGTDSVPAMLTPGEAVIPEPIAQDDRFKPLVAALVSGEIKQYKKGTVSAGDDYAHVGGGKLTNIDEIINKSGGGLSQTELRQAQMYKDILVATGQPGAAQAYGSLAYSFDSALNKAMAKQGVPYAAFEKAWLDRPDKWATSGFTASQASIVDRAILEQIKASGATIITDKHVDNAFRNLPESIKSTPTYRSMAQLHDKIGSYSLGKGLGSTPATSKQILEQAKKAGIIKDYRVEERVSSKGKQAIKSLYVVTNDGKEVYLGRGSKANRIYLADKSLSAAQKAAAKPKLVVGVGEKVKTKDGKVSAVTGQTGKPKPPGMKVVGGGQSDRRVISGSNIASIFPRGFRGPRLTGLGAEGGFGEGATQAERVAGIKGGSISSEYRQTQTKVQENLGKFDKEVKNTTKQTATLGQRFATGANVFSGLTIAGSFMGGKIGEISQKLAPLAIALSTITMLAGPMKAGMLKFGAFLATNPLAPLLLAVTVAIAGFKLIEARNKKMAKAQSDYVEAISATTEKMKKVGQVTGKVGASEIMQRRREGQTANKFTTGYDRAGQQFGTTFLESEVGKGIYDTFAKNFATAGSGAVKQISLELSAYVSDGLITAEQANSVARAIGINMSDMTIAANIQGELRSIIGPNGEDLATDPLKVRLAIIQEQQNVFGDVVDQLKAAYANSGFATKDQKNFAAALGATGAQSLEIIQAQRDAQAKMYDDKIRELEAQKATTKDKEKQQKIEQELSGLREQQKTDDAKLAQERQNLLKDQQEAYALIKKTEKFSFDKPGEVAMFRGLQEQVRTKYKGTGQEAFIESFIGKAKDTKSKELELTLTTLVGSGDLTPSAAIKLIDTFGKNNEAQLEAVINSKVALQNPDKFAQLSNIAGGLKGKGSKKISLELMTKMTAAGQEGAFDDRLAALTLLQQMDGKEINLAAFLEGDAIGKLDKLVPMLNAVEKIKTPITKDVVTNLSQNPALKALGPNAFASLAADWEHYVNLPAETQKTAIETFVSVFETIGAKEKEQFAINKAGGAKSGSVYDYWMSQSTSTIAAAMTKEQFAAGTKPNKIPKGPGAGGGAGTDPFEDLNKKLRTFRDFTISASGGLAQLKKLFKGDAAITKFSGSLQDLAAGPKGGINRAFLDYLSDLDQKTFLSLVNQKKFKKGILELNDTGLALKDTFNAIDLGVFQSNFAIGAQNTLAQQSAFIKLKNAGVDTFTAMELVSNEQLAVAINAKKSDGSIKQLADSFKKAEAATEAFNIQLEKSLIEDIKDFELLKQMPGLITNMKKLGLSTEQINKVLDNPDLAKSLMQDLADGKVDSELIARYLNSIPDTKKIKIDIQMQTPEGQYDIFKQGFDEAMNFFDAQEALITQQRAPGLKVITDEIDALQEKIAQAEEKIRPFEQTIADLQYKLEYDPDFGARAIDDLKKKIENEQKEIQKINDQIEQYRGEIEKRQRFIELNFERPIQALQEESNVLSNTLSLIEQQEGEINKKYDLQEQALQRVSEANQEILNQEKQRLSISDALTQGNIAAAASAAQEARAQAAQAASQRAGGVLQAAREAELGRVSVGGMTRTQIEQRQFQISQQIFNLEQQRKAIDAEILYYQDEIYKKQQLQIPFQNAIKDIETQIAIKEEQRSKWTQEIADNQFEIDKIKRAEIEPSQLLLEKAEKARDAYIKSTEELFKSLDYLGKTKDKWIETNVEIDAAKTKGEALATVMERNASLVNSIASNWKSIESKTVTLTINTVYTTSGSTSKDTTFTKTKMYGGKINGYMGGGKVKPIYLANGGAIGSDTVPAMLTPGEFVVNKASAKAFSPLLSAINDTKYPSILAKRFREIGADISGSFNSPVYSVSAPSNSTFVQPSYNVANASSISTPITNNSASVSDNSSSVYNYNVGITVGGTNVSPDSIARAVMNEIKYIDSQRVRGQRAV